MVGGVGREVNISGPHSSGGVDRGGILEEASVLCFFAGGGWRVSPTESIDVPHQVAGLNLMLSFEKDKQ